MNMESNANFANAGTFVTETVSKNWKWFLAMGISMIVLGALALALPHLSTLAVEVMVAWLFIFGGIALGIHAIQSRGEPALLQKLLGAFLYLVAGTFLLLFPLGGEITLTLVLAAFFLAAGVFRIMLASSLRPVRGWGWALTGGVLAIFLAMLILMRLPSSAGWAIGLIVGIDLFFAGWMLVSIALGFRKK